MIQSHLMKKTYKKTKKKSSNAQYEFRRANFSFYQYWIFYYTECYKDETEKDFVTFIKAKSYELAKNILVSKVKEDLPGTKIKSTQGYMLHKDYKNGRSNRHFSIKDWENVKASSFPNLSAWLFEETICSSLGRPRVYFSLLKVSKIDMGRSTR